MWTGRRKYVIGRFIAALGLTATLVAGATAASADTAPPALPSIAVLHPQAVLTDINGMVTVFSTKWNRMVVVGQDDDARPFVAQNTTYAVIDIAGHRLVSRRNTNSIIDSTVIDEQRGLAYLTVGTTPTRVTGAGTSYHLDLWTINLRNGRLLSDRLFYEGEQATVNAMGVDAPSGHIFIATTRPGSGTYELMMVDPSSMSLHIQSLEGTPDHVFVDSLHHRVVVTTMEGIQATTSLFIGFDTRTERREWSHLFTYTLSSYTNYAMVYDDHTKQIWSVAPGGLVTVVNTSNGSIARQIQMGYTRPDGWAQVGFALDVTHDMGYAHWTAPNSCDVDRASVGAAVRQTFVNYAGYPCGAANATLITVDEARQHIFTADGTALHEFSTAGKLLKTYSMLDAKGQPSTWFTSTTIQQGGHATLVIVSDVYHQNEATGADTTGAAVFVPLS